MSGTTTSILPIVAGLQPYEWLTLLGIIVGPILAVLISLWIENRRRDRDQKLIILRLLLTTRHLVGDPNYSAAINLIPIEFAGNTEVQTAYRDFIEAAHADTTPENAQKVAERTAVKQTKLIFAIARSMRFKIAETDIQTTAYAAQGWIERDNLALDSQKAMRDVANILWVQTRLLGGESWQSIQGHDQTPLQSDPPAQND
jgi:hypothetical protein